MTPSSATRRRLPYGDRSEQFGELWLPTARAAPPPPVVVLYHGGFWKARYTYDLMDGLAQDLVDRGLAVWNVEYRRVGAGGGGGGWPMTYEDAAAAFAAVEELPGLDRHRVVTCGHSAGGHLALWVSMQAHRNRLVPSTARPLPRFAISLAGVTDIVAAAEQGLGAGAAAALMGGAPSELVEPYRRASLLAALPLGLPQLVVHGTADDVVPPAMAESYAHAARAAGDHVELVLADGADHMAMIDPASPAWDRTAQRVVEILA